MATQGIPTSETIHRCPECGNTDIAYDYVATVIARFKDGVLAYIVVEEPFQGAAPTVFCDRCCWDERGGPSGPRPTLEQEIAAYEAITAVLPAPTDELTIYKGR